MARSHHAPSDSIVATVAKCFQPAVYLASLLALHGGLGWLAWNGLVLVWSHKPSFEDLLEVTWSTGSCAWSAISFILPLIAYLFLGFFIFRAAQEVCPSLRHVYEFHPAFHTASQQPAIEYEIEWHCKICFDTACTRAAFTACGHVICEECGKRVSRSACPYCKRKSKVVRLYE